MKSHQPNVMHIGQQRSDWHPCNSTVMLIALLTVAPLPLPLSMMLPPPHHNLIATMSAKTVPKFKGEPPFAKERREMQNSRDNDDKEDPPSPGLEAVRGALRP